MIHFQHADWSPVTLTEAEYIHEVHITDILPHATAEEHDRVQTL